MMPMGHKFDDQLWLDWPKSSQLSPEVVTLQPTSASDISEQWSALSLIIGIQCCILLFI